MPSPFLGMDPYLEHPALWPGLHSRLIVGLADELGPPLRPRYYVEVEERVYLLAPAGSIPFSARPDVSVVAAPWSRPPAGPVPAPTGGTRKVELPVPEEVRERYLVVREAGTHRVITRIEALSPTNKAPGEGRLAYLKKREMDLGRFLQTIYGRAAHNLRVNYEEEPIPSLEPPFAEWADARFRELGARRVR